MNYYYYYHYFILQVLESSGPKLLETAEEIQERRQEVLSRYQKFKDLVIKRGQKLEESYYYQVFRQEAEDFEKWIMEKLTIANDKSYEDPTNIQVIQFLYLPRPDLKTSRERYRFSLNWC